MTRVHAIGVALVLAALLAPAPSGAAQPVVIVVRGVGADTETQGFSAPTVRRLWGVDRVREVRFRYQDGVVPQTFSEYLPQATDWARQIQLQLLREVEAAYREGRPVLLVAHSWGSVSTAIALSGGGDQGRPVGPIRFGDPEARIDQFVSLGSPIGRIQRGIVLDVPEGTIPIHLSVPAAKPAVVGAWTNFVNLDEPRFELRREAAGAQNVLIRGSGYPHDLSGENIERTFWYHPDVLRTLGEARRDLAAAGAPAADTAAADTVLADTAAADTSATASDSVPSVPPAETRAVPPPRWRTVRPVGARRAADAVPAADTVLADTRPPASETAARRPGAAAVPLRSVRPAPRSVTAKGGPPEKAALGMRRRGPEG